MKDEILNILNMKDILNKYGIEIKKYMCHCPFHKDNSPSMKVYKKSFYCFSCNRTGDLIEFVKQYFNLNFQEAMEKINYDFNLGLKTRGRLNKKRLIELQRQQKLKREEEKRRKTIINSKLIEASNRYRIYNKVIYNLKQEITKENWEDKVEVIAFLQDKIELIDWYMENLINKKK
jgi:DNA primase